MVQWNDGIWRRIGSTHLVVKMRISPLTAGNIPRWFLYNVQFDSKSIYTRCIHRRVVNLYERARISTFLQIEICAAHHRNKNPLQQTIKGRFIGRARRDTLRKHAVSDWLTIYTFPRPHVRGGKTRKWKSAEREICALLCIIYVSWFDTADENHWFTRAYNYNVERLGFTIHWTGSSLIVSSKSTSIRRLRKTTTSLYIYMIAI